MSSTVSIKNGSFKYKWVGEQTIGRLKIQTVWRQHKDDGVRLVLWVTACSWDSLENCLEI